MTSYKIKYHKKASKFIKTHKDVGLRIYKAFQELSVDKYSFAKYDIKKYHGGDEDMFRMRIGKYRAIFQVLDDEILIYVLDIDSRGDIYK